MKIDPYTLLFVRLSNSTIFDDAKMTFEFTNMQVQSMMQHAMSKQKIEQAFWHLALLDFLLFQEVEILIKVI